jgi:predicted PurR-regulated permease PerM
VAFSWDDYNRCVPSTPLTVAPIEAVPASRPWRRPSNEEIAAWLLLAALLAYVLFHKLVPAVVAGLALYLILDRLSRSFSKRIPRVAARPLALLLVTVVGGGLVVGVIAMGVSFMRRHADNIPAVMTKMADILQSTQAWLGGFGGEIIPDVITDAETIKAAAVVWLKAHAETLKIAGSSLSLGLVHVIMGILLAIMVFFRHVTHRDEERRGPLARCLVEKIERFAHAFSAIATAQIKISAVNTTLTAAYVFVILPLFGMHLPFAPTIVLLTFICGLIPVLGNLISNTVIVVLSLGISVGTAIASLVFLVLIHKLEYLINSRIVGGETDSQAWEILMAILLGETAFGVGGVVMAPIIYAFIKRELRDRELV